ncbi:MAG: cyclase family protein [bacterium]
MKIQFEISGQSYGIDVSRPNDISIPLLFDGGQPNTYEVPKASARPCQTDEFIGDTRKGGSCNFDEITLIPHCNGTHTECVGHISLVRISIQSILKKCFIPATLITVKPVSALSSTDTYQPAKNDGDHLISRDSLRIALKSSSPEFLQGLIVRTQQNSKTKMTRRYLSEPPPYFSLEAMQLIKELGVQHLLVDVPSVDRAFDQGLLTAHHLFWDVPQGSHEVDAEKPSSKTITEMIYVDDKIKDGKYFVNIQIPAFVSDAAPSRPLLYEIDN